MKKATVSFVRSINTLDDEHISEKFTVNDDVTTCTGYYINNVNSSLCCLRGEIVIIHKTVEHITSLY